MHITVNGRPHDIEDGARVIDVITALGVPRSGVAVAVDGEVVRRAEWELWKLADGAAVEVLTAVQGG